MNPRAVAATVLSGLALVPIAAGRRARAAEPSLVELLTSAGEYVRAYEDTFRVVVAEEVYVQRRRPSSSGPVQDTRRLSSDVVFVHTPGTALPWWLLRDVYEVDGRAVRDRQARLEKLLVEGDADGIERARAIADEGARFNRPYPPLAVWVPGEMRDRFETEIKGTRGRSGSLEFVEGLAAYSGFRQAGVSTQEQFRLPEPETR